MAIEQVWGKSYLRSMTSRFGLVIALFMLHLTDVYGTWSIILVDSETKEIGIAGASCTPNVFGIGAIVPGKGAIVVQAMSNKWARAKGIQMILANASPEQIVQKLLDSIYNPEQQQYGIICLNKIRQPLAYTGELTTADKGSLTAPGISVQGNTLANKKVLERIFSTIVYAQNESCSLDYILMLALEAGAKAGGDKRCGVQTATSAFITVMKPTDSVNQPYLNLVVSGINRGGVNAVKVLRVKYNTWKKDH